MKSKHSKKRSKIITPTPTPATNLAEAVPPGIEFFAKLQTLSPRDFVTQLFAPKLKSASDEEAKLVIECFAGMLSAIPQFYDFGVQVPEWVKAASKKYWELSGINFNEIDKWNMLEMGKFIGLMEIALAKENPPEIKNAATSICEAARTEAGKSPAKVAKLFFTEVENGEKAAARMKEPPKRIKVFMLISMAWRHVEKFENAGQLHRWLVEIDAFDGSITDPAETRKICRLIGLRLRDKVGKPIKQK